LLSSDVPNIEEIAVREVVVVGGGLVGSLASSYLASRGFRVTVYERMADMRSDAGSAGRSINLVATSRGLDALAEVGLSEQVLELTVPVTGRTIHGIGGEQSYQPYGKDDSECNYSISRAELNRFLITAAEKRGVEFNFESPLAGAELDQGRLWFGGDTTRVVEVEADVIFGADGAASVTRTHLMKQPGYDESVRLLSHDYKELTIPVDQGRTMRQNTLHIWPRGDLMLMALPNRDGSFTVTIYLPQDGPFGFGGLQDAASVRQLFETYFADAIPLIPDLEQAFLANPSGNLGTVKCFPWNLEGRVLLIGDAAHAIVPFFGQGMNCGFEDCSVLGALIDEHGASKLEQVFAAFGNSRKPNSDAIADMALENFVEMKEKVGDSRFLLAKQVEHRLEQAMPRKYRSRYSMVMYSSIPYSVAMEAGLVQQQILDELCSGVDDAESVNLQRASDLIEQKLTPLLARRGVELNY
jgi:kynurenine 3-monooxygenase